LGFWDVEGYMQRQLRPCDTTTVSSTVNKRHALAGLMYRADERNYYRQLQLKCDKSTTTSTTTTPTTTTIGWRFVVADVAWLSQYSAKMSSSSVNELTWTKSTSTSDALVDITRIWVTSAGIPSSAKLQLSLNSSRDSWTYRRPFNYPLSSSTQTPSASVVRSRFESNRWEKKTFETRKLPVDRYSSRVGSEMNQRYQNVRP